MTRSDSVFLVDTNILVYAYDAADPAKMRRAIEVLRLLQASRLGGLSVQVLSEFYTNVIRKPAVPLTRDEASEAVNRYARSWRVFDVRLRACLQALRGVKEYSLSYWDSLIWATALLNDVPNILTEDQQHGRTIEGVRYYDPFADDFELSLLS